MILCFIVCYIHPHGDGLSLQRSRCASLLQFSILVPRFLASAFCSGPAFMILVFLVVRKFTKFKIDDKAIQKIAELVAYAMFINLLLLGAELFKEYYTGSIHLAPVQYLFQGLTDGHNALVPRASRRPCASTSPLFSSSDMHLRQQKVTLVIGCTPTSSVSTSRRGWRW